MEIGEYLLNPNLAMRTFQKGGQIVNIQTAAPKRGSHVKFDEFHFEKDADDYQQMIRLVASSTHLNGLRSPFISRALGANLLVKSQEISALPRFKPVLVPSNDLAHDLRINEDMSTTAPKDTEAFPLATLMAEPTTDECVLWVRDPYTNLVWPIYLEQNLKNQIEEIRSGSLRPDTLPSEVRSSLFAARILVENRKCSQGDQSSYRLRRCIRMETLFPSPYRMALAHYFNRVREEGWCRYGDKQTKDRFWNHNDLLARFVHEQLESIVSHATGFPWRASFCTYLDYVDGSDLKKHLDRAQAHITLSILIDYEKDGIKSSDQWPIFVERASNTNQYDEYTVGLGNGVLFNGENLLHYRDALPKGHYSRSLCFHFVPSDFQGKLL